MIIEPSGIFFTGECDIRAEDCTALLPAPITAVRPQHGGLQINVCRNCLATMIREGQWEVPGSKLTGRLDLAVVDYRGDLQLAIEIKTYPRSFVGNLKERAVQIHRNLMAHAAIPESSYLIVVYYPEKMYLWNKYATFDSLPNYESDIAQQLNKYADKVSHYLSEYQQAEAAIRLWMTDLLSPVSDANKKSAETMPWWTESGLQAATAHGSIVHEHPTRSPIAV